MNENLKEILTRKLIIVTGKGGVGKSLLTASLGRIAAATGKQALLLELGETRRMADLFNRPAAAGCELQTLAPRITGLACDYDAAQEAFAISILKLKILYHALIRSKILKNFIDAIPGLHDLVVLHQVWRLLNPQESGEPTTDLLIMDAPATGHALNLLRSPDLLRSVIRVGPVRRILNNIVELLNDRRQTIVVCITQAEDLPVTEALEFIESVKRRLNLAVGPIIVNNVQGITTEGLEDVASRSRAELEHLLSADARLNPYNEDIATVLAAHELLRNRLRIQKRHLERIARSGHPYLITPLLEPEQSEADKVVALAAWMMNPSHEYVTA